MPIINKININHDRKFPGSNNDQFSGLTNINRYLKKSCKVNISSDK